MSKLQDDMQAAIDHIANIKPVYTGKNKSYGGNTISYKLAGTSNLSTLQRMALAFSRCRFDKDLKILVPTASADEVFNRMKGEMKRNLLDTSYMYKHVALKPDSTRNWLHNQKMNDDLYEIWLYAISANTESDLKHRKNVVEILRYLKLRGF